MPNAQRLAGELDEASKMRAVLLVDRPMLFANALPIATSAALVKRAGAGADHDQLK